MPRFGLPHLRHLSLLSALLLAVVLPATAGARQPNLKKYPLRIHVLASGEVHRTPRMTPGEAVACDAVDDMLSAVDPGDGAVAVPIAFTGFSGDACGLHSGNIAGNMLQVAQEETAFSGEGRGDLVSPPTLTQAVSFQYDDCSRVRVLSGFESLRARWKKAGKTLEVLVPSDEIPVGGRPLAPVKCTFHVSLENFVYLLLPGGRLIQVTQDLYQQKPALRFFLNGGTQMIQPRQQLNLASNPAAAATPSAAPTAGIPSPSAPVQP